MQAAFFVAGGQGFEPQLMVPETIVLPIKLSPSNTVVTFGQPFNVEIIATSGCSGKYCCRKGDYGSGKASNPTSVSS